MKKIVTLALCLLLALGIAVTASAAASASMSGVPSSIDKDETATITVKLSGTPDMTSAMVQVQLADGLSLVSGQWIKSAPLNSFDMNTNYGVLGGFSGNLDGDVFKLVIKGVTPSAAAKSVKVSFTFKSGSAEVGTTSVSKNVIVACPGHSYGSWTKADDNQHSQTCIHCGDVKKANHGWDKGTEIKPASCKEEGEMLYTCNDCGATKTVKLDKTNDHKYGTWVKVDDSKHSKTCSVCNDVVTENHDWDSVETLKATCKDPGVITHTCKVAGCGASYTEDIPVDDDAHVFGNLTAVDDVNHKDTCSVCKKDITEAHAYDGGVVTKKPNCKEEGEKTYTCGECNHKKVEKMDKTTDHSYGKWTEVDGTNHKHICSVCEKEETATHNWNSGAVTKKPNCKETGIKTFTCKDCGATYTEDIEKTEDHKYGAWIKVDADNHKHICSVCEKEETVAHSYKTSWSKDKSGHWHECSGCKDKIEFAEHTPGPEATEKNPQTCTVCKYVIKPALGHTHKWDKELTHDEEGHWYACSGCEEKKDAAAHDFENGCDPDCATCGYTREVAHNISDAWSSNGTNHWHECTICGLKEDTAAHEAGAEATEFTAQTCTICGKELVAALGHSFSEEWNSDADNHWHDCACGEKGDLAAHTYENGVCSACGAEEPKSFLIWIIVGVAAVAVVAVVAVVIIKKKK